MISAIEPIATAIMVLVMLMAPAMGITRALATQIAFLPMANVYLAGFAIAGTGLWLILRRVRRPDLLLLPRQILTIWLIWLFVALISGLANGLSLREASQLLEFLFYGAVAAFAFNATRYDEGARRTVLMGMVAMGALASLVALAVASQGSAGWEDGPWGRNEIGLAIVVGSGTACLAAAHRVRGIRLVPYYLVFLLGAVAVVSAGSRGAVVTLALLGFFGLLGKSIQGSWMARGLLLSSFGAVFAARASIATLVQANLDPSRNFSNIERLRLIGFGWELFRQRPIRGWGWGSIESILPRSAVVALDYPHLHNMYVRFLAELGIGGAVVLLLIFWFLMSAALDGIRGRTPVATAFNIYLLLAVGALGMVDVLFYGANRALVVSIALGVGFSLPTRTPVLESGTSI